MQFSVFAQENGLINVLKAADRAAILWAKSIVREHCSSLGCRRVQSTETNCLGYDKEVQGPWNPWSSSRKWLALQDNSRSPGYDQGANANWWQDYSNSTCEDERCRLRVQEYDYSSMVDSWLDRSQQQILLDNQDTKQRKENVVDTREPAQQVWKYCLDWWIYDSIRKPPNIFL